MARGNTDRLAKRHVAVTQDAPELAAPPAADDYPAAAEIRPFPTSAEADGAIREMLAHEIARANFELRFGDAASLERIAVTLGELRHALPHAQGVTSLNLQAALQRLFETI